MSVADNLFFRALMLCLRGLSVKFHSLETVQMF